MGGQVIYMPKDPSGWNPILDAATLEAEKYRERERQKAGLIMSLLGEYGGTLDESGMQSLEKGFGFRGGPLTQLARGNEPSSTVLRNAFQPTYPTSTTEEVEGGYNIVPGMKQFRMPSKQEREVSTYKEKTGIETESKKELGKYQIGLDVERFQQLDPLQKESAFQDELKRIRQLEPEKAKVEIEKLYKVREAEHEIKKKYFDENLEMTKQELIQKGDIDTANKIDLIKKEYELKHKLEMDKIKEDRITEFGKMKIKTGVEIEKEIKTNYNQLKKDLKWGLKVAEGDPVDKDMLEQVRAYAQSQGFDVRSEPTPISSGFLRKQKYLFTIVDPDTGQPPAIYPGNIGRPGNKETKAGEITGKKDQYGFIIGEKRPSKKGEVEYIGNNQWQLTKKGNK